MKSKRYDRHELKEQIRQLKAQLDEALRPQPVCSEIVAITSQATQVNDGLSVGAVTHTQNGDSVADEQISDMAERDYNLPKIASKGYPLRSTMEKPKSLKEAKQLLMNMREW